MNVGRARSVKLVVSLFCFHNNVITLLYTLNPSFYVESKHTMVVDLLQIQETPNARVVRGLALWLPLVAPPMTVTTV